MLNPKNQTPDGILHLPCVENLGWLKRYEPSATLRRWIEHYWTVAWSDLPPTTRETIPHPSVQLVFEKEEATIHGVYRRRFTRTLEGTGRVLGIKFRPGGFHPFHGKPVGDLTGRLLDGDQIWGQPFRELAKRIAGENSAEQAFEKIDRFFCAAPRHETELVNEVIQLVEQIKSRREITRVNQLHQLDGNLSDRSPRQLQRLFFEFVGISPKQTIQRFRLIEASKELRRQKPIDFAAVSLKLGYSDQAHFIRDFKRMVGLTPASYVQQMKTD